MQREAQFTEEQKTHLQGKGQSSKFRVPVQGQGPPQPLVWREGSLSLEEGETQILSI